MDQQPAGDGAAPARRTRLSPEREGEILEAVLDLLREDGYDVLTMEAVAARCKASKATLYRQWTSRPRLVAAALLHGRPFSLDGLDTGSFAGDLHELCGRMAAGKKDAALIRGIAPAAHRDRELSEVLHATLVQPQLDVVGAILDRAVARGEVPPDAPAGRFLAHLLVGPVFARPFVDRREPDARYLADFLDSVVLPLFRTG